MMSKQRAHIIRRRLKAEARLRQLYRDAEACTDTRALIKLASSHAAFARREMLSEARLLYR